MDGYNKDERSTNKDPKYTKDHMNRDLPRADRRFFEQASRLGKKEVALSKIAADRASNSQVRAFAADMVTAHTAANTELKTLVGQKGAMIDHRDDALEERELKKEWKNKKAEDFDKDYINTMIDAHEDTIDVLENGADSKDGDISAYANKLLPKVKSHLDRAEKIEAMLD
jgi:putative membrane protein